MEEVLNLLRSSCAAAQRAQELLKELGVDVSVYNGPSVSILKSNGEEIRITIRKGIRKLAELAGVEPFHPVDWVGKPDKKYLAVLIDGVLFEQCGEQREEFSWD